MNIEEIENEWEKDSEIDPINLDTESLNISRLQAKYLKEYTRAKFQAAKIENELKVLYKEKYEFFVYTDDNIVQKYNEKGWSKGGLKQILKSEADTYIQADEEYVTLKNKHLIQKEKTEALQYILKELSSRSFNIQNAVSFRRLQAGLNG